MNKYIRKIKTVLTNPASLIYILSEKGHFKFLSDKTMIKIAYKANMGKSLNLKPPTTYSEKLQWLKLYNHNPLYTKLVDKYEVKSIVSGIIGEEYVIPTIGVYDTFDEIDFTKLPSAFVIKCTHDSGGLIICRKKEDLDIDQARVIIEKGLKRNYFSTKREWPYKNVPPRIIIEPYLEDEETHELRDYKFFCFNGEVKALFIASDRMNKNTETKFDFFDANFNHLPFTQGHPNATTAPEKPSQFELMKELASKLSKGIPHVRVDFYEVNGKVLFGEMTFFHFSGMRPFVPSLWDVKFGEWLKLPEIKN